MYINEDFWKEALKIRKQKWNRLKAVCKQGKYPILVYDRIYTR